MTAPMLHIGFTGTRHGMSALQEARVLYVVSSLWAGAGFVAHHGDCVGADAELHRIARRYPNTRVVIHPGPIGELSAGCFGDERRDPLPHMRRNRVIVNESQIMIAAPYEDEPQPRGGTWATIGMARKALERGQLRDLLVVGREGQLLDHTKWKRGRP